jgi:chromate reductase, NAD(P)H dehydrogenase (quinone)
MAITVAAFSGSLRKESFNTKLIRAFQQLAPKGIAVKIIPIGDLPHINEDLETELPAAVISLHKSIEAADAILLATPEYNRSYSPVLKNALDWGSRPQGKNKWDGKPALVIGASPYSLGAFGAQHHLRQVLVYINMYPLQQPEFYLSKAAEKFNAAGELTDEDTRKLIAKVWTGFAQWIDKINRKG